MKKKRYVILGILIAVIIVAFFIITGVKSNIENDLKELSNLTISDVDLTNVPDGIYSGSYKVFPVSAKVNVTVKGHKISDIELVEHKHGQGAPAEIIPSKVVEAQTLEVDVVSGATYSSKVILKAIENALTSSIYE